MEKNDEQRDTEAILNVIAGESTAFWNKDFDAWAQCWVHAPYIRSMGWTSAEGVSYVAGWDTLSTHTRGHLARDPIPNPNAANVRRENFNIRIYGDSAWVTFDQYGKRQVSLLLICLDAVGKLEYSKNRMERGNLCTWDGFSKEAHRKKENEFDFPDIGVTEEARTQFRRGSRLRMVKSALAGVL